MWRNHSAWSSSVGSSQASASSSRPRVDGAGLVAATRAHQGELAQMSGEARVELVGGQQLALGLLVPSRRGESLAGRGVHQRRQRTLSGFDGDSSEVDPGFTDPEAGDLSPSGDRAATVDQGHPTLSSPQAMGGVPRDGQPDAGAFEWGDPFQSVVDRSPGLYLLWGLLPLPFILGGLGGILAAGFFASRR